MTQVLNANEVVLGIENVPMYENPASHWTDKYHLPLKENIIMHSSPNQYK